jgi:hypothetical protein
MPALLAEVTRAQESAATVKATRVTVVFAVETSTQEAIAARDCATLHVEDSKGRAALVEREVLEWVSRVEVKTVVALASAREDVDCFARKIALLEAEVAAEHCS